MWIGIAQWDRTAHLCRRFPLGGFYRVARIKIRHRLFRVGDFVMFEFNNGQADRFPVFAVSSKGYRVKNYWMRVCGCMEILELPVQLIGRSPIDPAPRDWILDILRAGDGRCPVSADNRVGTVIYRRADGTFDYVPGELQEPSERDG